MRRLSPHLGARLLPLVLALAATTPSTVADNNDDNSYPREVSDDDCDCFLTDGEESNYFLNHQFWDFRSLTDYYNGIPSVQDTLSSSRDAEETSDFFTSDRWTSTWALQNWNNSGENPFGGANYMMMNSFSNVYVDLNGDSSGDDVSDTYLVLRTAKLEDFQSAAEFQSQDEDYHFLSMRMYARTAGDPGACTAMFTYRENDDIYAVQEADIEILTSGPEDVVQFTNQPSFTANGKSIDESTQNVTLPDDNTWTDWKEYRLDWSEGVTSWYVDGEFVSKIEFQAPKDPASIILNTWGDGGEWTGQMEEGGRAYLQLQWWEFVYNKTDDNESKRRKKRDWSEGGLLGRLLKRDDDDDEQCAKIFSCRTTNLLFQALKLFACQSTGLEVNLFPLPGALLPGTITRHALVSRSSYPLAIASLFSPLHSPPYATVQRYQTPSPSCTPTDPPVTQTPATSHQLPAARSPAPSCAPRNACTSNGILFAKPDQAVSPSGFPAPFGFEKESGVSVRLGGGVFCGRARARVYSWRGFVCGGEGGRTWCLTMVERKMS
ncbi:glycoside hydrolase family 16 protein [Zalerion maritima]|uniref:Glycoside hydrolase family 16 protein n=1 Tax=Zalerion maritima TaxID=339359 RepID=A0AAD5RVS8_9PEZI|nr:glycoside hydrolase family 16 protein [Zalerion maritima]